MSTEKALRCWACIIGAMVLIVVGTLLGVALGGQLQENTNTPLRILHAGLFLLSLVLVVIGSGVVYGNFRRLINQQ